MVGSQTAPVLPFLESVEPTKTNPNGSGSNDETPCWAPQVLGLHFSFYQTGAFWVPGIFDPQPNPKPNSSNQENVHQPNYITYINPSL